MLATYGKLSVANTDQMHSVYRVKLFRKPYILPWHRKQQVRSRRNSLSHAQSGWYESGCWRWDQANPGRQIHWRSNRNQRSHSAGTWEKIKMCDVKTLLPAKLLPMQRKKAMFFVFFLRGGGLFVCAHASSPFIGRQLQNKDSQKEWQKEQILKWFIFAIPGFLYSHLLYIINHCWCLC